MFTVWLTRLVGAALSVLHDRQWERSQAPAVLGTVTLSSIPPHHSAGNRKGGHLYSRQTTLLQVGLSRSLSVSISIFPLQSSRINALLTGSHSASIWWGLLIIITAIPGKETKTLGEWGELFRFTEHRIKRAQANLYSYNLKRNSF